MSQDNYNNSEKNNPFGPGRGNNLPPGGNNNSPKKNFRFGNYWALIIILAIMLGLQFFNPFGTSTNQISEGEFKEMVKKGDVEKDIIVNNRDVVRVWVKKEQFV
ncbi:MAG: ATP-dependent metallopeptidase FtsH/Yme1/Tma family protein [Niabella sp.]